MSVFNERPGSMRARTSGQPPFDIRMDTATAAESGRTRTGRKLAPVDNGTVALAISGMAFYWMKPMMMGRGRRRRRASGSPQA